MAPHSSPAQLASSKMCETVLQGVPTQPPPSQTVQFKCSLSFELISAASAPFPGLQGAPES